MDVIFLDTETTDSTPGARLIQLAFKDRLTGTVYNSYFKPPRAISFQAMAIHHITEEKIVNSPCFDTQRSEMQMILNNAVLVAHNAKFDIGILKNEGLTVPRSICTLQVARHLIKADSHQLQYLRYFLGLDVEAKNAHDALDDVLVLEALFEYLFELVKNSYTNASGPMSDGSVLIKMIELTDQPVLVETLKFGKHKDKTIPQIMASDPGYLVWLKGSILDKPDAERDQDLLHTINFYLNNKGSRPVVSSQNSLF